MITKPIKGLTFDSTYVYDSGYYYFRNHGDRILFGGGRNIDFESEECHELENTEKIKENLVFKLKELWKGSF